MAAFGSTLPLPHAGEDDEAPDADDSDEISFDEENESICWVWPENWDGLLVFLSLTSLIQRRDFNGRCWSLDRTNIESTLRMMGYEPSRHHQLLSDYLVMENAALEGLNRE